jgi:homocysteine S-methyltransferase
MTPRQTLLQQLTDPDAFILFDGAIGTTLYANGVYINQCYDELNLRSPDLVRSVHRSYRDAGAEVLETNTFGANRLKLAAFGLEAQVEEINRAAATLARDVAGDDLLVAGAVGPLGVRLEPYGPTSLSEAREYFAEQMRGVRAGGADCVILETFSDLHEIEQAILAARELDPAIPVIAQMAIGEDGLTAYGAGPAQIARALDGYGADIVGLNCSVGPQAILAAIEGMAGQTRRKLSAQPNAGMPRQVAGRTMYMASPEYLATYARNLLQAGAKVLGGCCGTTPAHIRAIAQGVRPLVPRMARTDRQRDSGNAAGSRSGVQVGPDAAGGAATQQGVTPVPFAQRSRWAAKIARGEFVTSVEIVPPRGVDPNRMLGDVATLKEGGVDAVNVPDGPRAQSRMAAVLTSVLIEQRVGIDTVTHYCCRDRNLLGMLSDLLGASAVGLRNILIITGDPPKMGPYPDATAVFDIDSIGLTNLVRNLNRGLDPGGNAIGAPTQFAIGVGVNPAPIDLDHELRRFDYKVEAGAEYAITQPVFDLRQIETFLKRIEHVRIPIIAGVWPLVSVRNAEFLANEVPGVVIPPEVIARMRKASDQSREHAVAEGIRIAQEMVAGLGAAVQGIQVSAPLGRADLALQVLQTSATLSTRGEHANTSLASSSPSA